MTTVEEKRAKRVEYMRRYRRDKGSRSEEGKKYWQKHKQQIMRRRHAKPEKIRAANKAYWAKNKERLKPINNARNRRRYQERKEEILAHAKLMGWQTKRLEVKAGRRKPDNCEVCGTSNETITFDHCHQRGVFRGWICTSCNKILGFANDDINRLRKLIAYLERTKDLMNSQLTLPGV